MPDQLNERGEIVRYANGFCGPACGHDVWSVECDRINSTMVGLPKKRELACLRGEHEAELEIAAVIKAQPVETGQSIAEKIAEELDVVFLSLPIDEKDDDGKDHYYRLLICRHCRCLFVER